MDNLSIKTPQPFFSIVIATYNRANLVKRALKSLISQTETDWEAIIINDGSTDNTYEQILPYIKDYAKIRYVRKVHSGVVQSKNKGINLSNGKYISFLDSDDEYSSNHLKTRKQILLDNPTVKFLYGGVEIIGNQYVPDRFDHSKKIHLSKCVIGGTFFIERQSLISLSGFSEVPIGTDADLFERAENAKIKMMETNLPSYIYNRTSKDSITNRMLLSV
ncbi:MAG: glycosyltransferase family A protein [Bacteroidales bacterium]|nr:glycosyltransferase family A protein [Bacteroidales bacterium]MDD3892564.1 glycosyltransferase family A protein [Bacteroidales bacterium]